MLVVQLVLLALSLGDAPEVLRCEQEILLDKLEVLLKSVDLRNDPFQIKLSPHILLEPFKLTLFVRRLLPHVLGILPPFVLLPYTSTPAEVLDHGLEHVLLEQEVEDLPE